LKVQKTKAERCPFGWKPATPATQLAKRTTIAAASATGPQRDPGRKSFQTPSTSAITPISSSPAETPKAAAREESGTRCMRKARMKPQ
jgi:hypothetical protein